MRSGALASLAQWRCLLILIFTMVGVFGLRDDSLDSLDDDSATALSNSSSTHEFEFELEREREHERQHEHVHEHEQAALLDLDATHLNGQRQSSQECSEIKDRDSCNAAAARCLWVCNFGAEDCTAPSAQRCRGCTNYIEVCWACFGAELEEAAACKHGKFNGIPKCQDELCFKLK